jgi:hypothetical protein
MFLKSSVMIAAAVLCGSVSVASAQYNPRFADDSQQMSYGARPGVAIPAPTPAAAPRAPARFADDSDQAGYSRNTGMSAFASAPGASAPAGARFGGISFDDAENEQ